MCRAVTCQTCGKTTWAGCGQHVSSVRANVPANQWCGGHAATEVVAPKRDGRAAERFVRRMATPGGRALRIAAGAALITAGAVLGGAGLVLAVVGLVPILAGLTNHCVIAPVLGVSTTRTNTP